jgi:Cu/Ag efflux protein CusF
MGVYFAIIVIRRPNMRGSEGRLRRYNWNRANASKLPRLLNLRALHASVIMAAALASGTGCSRGQQPRLYQLRGYVVRLDTDTNLATIHNEKIEGWMAEMTMQYPVVNRDEYLSLHKGEKITGTVNVSSEGYWLTDVKERKGE